MQNIFNLIAGAAGIYSLLIFIRIIFSWFGKNVTGKPIELIGKITDPYLDWWRNSLNLRIGILDISPVIAITVLSVVQNIFSRLARFDRISLGNLLSIVLLSVWSVIAFVLGFCLIVIVIRLIAHLTNRNIRSPFWNVINEISQPVLYRINKIIFNSSIPRFINGLVVSIIALTILRIGGGLVMPWLAGFLSRLPF